MMLIMKRNVVWLWVLSIAMLILPSSERFIGRGKGRIENRVPELVIMATDTLPPRVFTLVPRDIPVKSYFRFLKEIVAAYDTVVPYPLSEHLLVRANPWIIDTLENTDYYRRIQRNDTLLVQPDAIVLHGGDTLFFS